MAGEAGWQDHHARQPARRQLALQVPVLQLDGNVKQNKVTARGTLSGNAAGQWKIPGIDLALGRNQLNVKGQLDEKSWNLDANIDAPRLDGALPGLGAPPKGC